MTKLGTSSCCSFVQQYNLTWAINAHARSRMTIQLQDSLHCKFTASLTYAKARDMQEVPRLNVAAGSYITATYSKRTLCWLFLRSDLTRTSHVVVYPAAGGDVSRIYYS